MILPNASALGLAPNSFVVIIVSQSESVCYSTIDFKVGMNDLHIPLIRPVSFCAMTVLAITFISFPLDTFFANNNSTSPICRIKKTTLCTAGGNFFCKSSWESLTYRFKNRVRASFHSSSNNCVFVFM